MWFNSDIWFEMEDVGQVTTYPHKTEVFTNTGDVITITFNGSESADVKRYRGDKVDMYTLGYLHVKYNVEKLKGYAIKHEIYMNVTDPREWESPVVVEEGQTKNYKGVAADKARVVRGYENVYPYQRLTALVLPDGAVRLMRYGNRTYKVANQVRYPSWTEFAEANNYIAEIPEMEELSEIEIVEEQEVDVPDTESDDDTSSDYEPEKEREFYRSQARDRKRRRVEKTMRLLMAVGGDDENIHQLITPVDFHFHNMIRATKTGKLYRLDFANGAYMICGKGSITYAKANGETVWMGWEKPSDWNDIAVWIWDQPGFERPAFA